MPRDIGLASSFIPFLCLEINRCVRLPSPNGLDSLWIPLLSLPSPARLASVRKKRKGEGWDLERKILARDIQFCISFSNLPCIIRALLLRRGLPIIGIFLLDR